MLSVTDIIQAGNYLIANPRKLFKIFPKYVPEASTGPDFHVFHFSRGADPAREGVHRLLIAKRDCEGSQDEQGRYSPMPSYGPKLLHVKYNRRHGLDFHVFSPKDADISLPIRSLHILRGTDFSGGLNGSGLAALASVKTWRILGYDMQENPIQIAQFYVNKAIAGHQNHIEYEQV